MCLKDACAPRLFAHASQASMVLAGHLTHKTASDPTLQAVAVAPILNTRSAKLHSPVSLRDPYP